MQLNLFTPQRVVDFLHEPHLFDQKTSNPFSEKLLQRIWVEHAQRFNPLVTLKNEIVFIDHPGKLNLSNGPDFEYACLRDSEGLTWHGAIEFHLNEDDWFQHQHHYDANYDKVIAHIFLKEGTKRACNAAKQPIPFHIKLHVKNSTTDLLSLIPSKNKPLCSSVNHAISTQFWDQQIQHAAKKYFEVLCARYQISKQDKETYDQVLKQKIILELWSHLGIPHNREWMLDAAENWLNGLNSNHASWKTKGNRASEIQNKAVKYAESISRKVINVSLQNVNANEFMQCYEGFQKILSEEPTLSKNLQNRLMRFVFLPSIAAAISCYESHFNNQEKLYDLWLSIKTPLPNQIKNYFQSIKSFNENQQSLSPAQEIGWLAQKKFYCSLRACNQCSLIKNQKDILTTE